MTAIELRHLRALVAVADRVTLSPSALDDLEGIVGVPLVHRGQHAHGLTGAGRELLPVARSVLRELDDALRDLREPERRAPVLGLVGAFGHTLLPALHAELTIRERPAARVRQIALAEGFGPLSEGVDVGVYPLPLHPPAGLEFAVLGQAARWVALPRAHPLAALNPVPLSALLPWPLVLGGAHVVWWDELRELARRVGRPLTAGPDASSIYEALMLVAAGHGWTVSATRADFPVWDDVVLRQLGEVERVRIAAVWRNRTEAARELADALVAVAL
jgi:DNA-binding transcriptional LysR family regulator